MLCAWWLPSPCHALLFFVRGQVYSVHSFFVWSLSMSFGGFFAEISWTCWKVMCFTKEWLVQRVIRWREWSNTEVNSSIGALLPGTYLVTSLATNLHWISHWKCEWDAFLDMETFPFSMPSVIHFVCMFASCNKQGQAFKASSKKA